MSIRKVMNIRFRILIGIVAIIGIIIVIAETWVPTIPVTNTSVRNLDESQAIPPAPNEDAQTGHADESDTRQSEKDESLEPPVGQPAAGTSSSEENTPVRDMSNREEVPTSYDALLGKANEQISALQSSCQGALLSIYFQYIGASEKLEKRKLVTQGKDKLAQCDTSFDGIMISLEATLTTNNMPTEIISTYRSEYTKQKALAQSILD